LHTALPMAIVMAVLPAAGLACLFVLTRAPTRNRPQGDRAPESVA
jgi:hypothetical protein